MIRLLAVAAGGALGASLRFGLIALSGSFAEHALLVGALGANLLGCFLIGLLWVWSRRLQISSEINAFVFAGVLGSLTTFSTYGLLSVDLLRQGNLLLGGSYILTSNVAGFGLVYLGLLLGRRLFRPLPA